MDKAQGGRLNGGRWGWVGQEEVVGWKWRQLYLNNNLKKGKLKYILRQMKIQIQYTKVYGMQQKQI